MDISNMREEFSLSGLQRKDLEMDPVMQFEKWFVQAKDSGLIEPNAMTLATVDQKGQPSVRTVLLKFFDTSGFVFYTNYESKKARDIEGNPKVALLFPWLDLQRQVKILGHVEKVPTAQSLKYFLSRPRGSQLGAWCSNQSSVITTRSLLHAKFEEMKNKFQDKEVPLPAFWGGYRVVATEIEFWQGRTNRLHDRFNYTLQENGEWLIERLAP
ncbi:MAG: pyridoxamine 5'-phosphate oxidase [Saprospiraceae bacterium]|nr:pyridoxamine 5'-phosphate oxidase [Saprospiraceae bacterium]MCB9326159.1 pyridoxamine 5'-phosphate oxidase [Lewinellaceae bacterium]